MRALRGLWAYLACLDSPCQDCIPLTSIDIIVIYAGASHVNQYQSIVWWAQSSLDAFHRLNFAVELKWQIIVSLMDQAVYNFNYIRRYPVQSLVQSLLPTSLRITLIIFYPVCLHFGFLPFHRQTYRWLISGMMQFRMKVNKIKLESFQGGQDIGVHPTLLGLFSLIPPRLSGWLTLISVCLMDSVIYLALLMVKLTYESLFCYWNRST